MKKYSTFITERKKYSITNNDSLELQDFLEYVKVNFLEQPNLLRAAYARIKGYLEQIRINGFRIKKRNIDSIKQLLYTIFNFIEGNRNMDELKMWSNKLRNASPGDYDTLLNIIHDYNQTVMKLKSNMEFSSFTIKDWAFEVEEGIEEITEGLDEVSPRDEIQELFLNGDLSDNEKEEIKLNLPKKRLKDLSSNKNYRPGDIMLDTSDNKHYLVVESKDYEKYCDFGCAYIGTYLENNKDIDEDDFCEYVSAHNKADRDSGELQDVCKEEIERLGKEYKNKNK